MIVSLLSSIKVQKDELQQLKEQFYQIDINQDGTLSPEELKAGLSKMNLYELLPPDSLNSEDSFKVLMEMVDQDKDGKIDFQEFVAASIDHRALMNEENIRAVFDMLDYNGDGQISLEELKDNFKSGGDKNNEILQQIIKEVDKNNDNHISFEEFNEGMKQMLIKSFSEVK